ncbi:MAG TPA: glycerol kinase, partial [Candidatus Atribacteria bacterium]|nr:glycerol kinase [Candidatus Atribacteria bacterium]
RDDLLLQIQADFLGIPVERPHIMETTALGAYYVAGLGVGIFKDTKEIENRWKQDKMFYPKMDREKSEKLYIKWKDAVNRAKNWEENREVL